MSFISSTYRFLSPLIPKYKTEFYVNTASNQLKQIISKIPLLNISSSKTLKSAKITPLSKNKNPSKLLIEKKTPLNSFCRTISQINKPMRNRTFSTSIKDFNQQEVVKKIILFVHVLGGAFIFTSPFIYDFNSFKELFEKVSLKKQFKLLLKSSATLTFKELDEKFPNIKEASEHELAKICLMLVKQRDNRPPPSTCYRNLRYMQWIFCKLDFSKNYDLHIEHNNIKMFDTTLSDYLKKLETHPSNADKFFSILFTRRSHNEKYLFEILLNEKGIQIFMQHLVENKYLKYAIDDYIIKKISNISEEEKIFWNMLLQKHRTNWIVSNNRSSNRYFN